MAKMTNLQSAHTTQLFSENDMNDRDGVCVTQRKGMLYEKHGFSSLN